MVHKCLEDSDKPFKKRWKSSCSHASNKFHPVTSHSLSLSTTNVTTNQGPTSLCVQLFILTSLILTSREPRLTILVAVSFENSYSSLVPWEMCNRWSTRRLAFQISCFLLTIKVAFATSGVLPFVAKPSGARRWALNLTSVNLMNVKPDPAYFSVAVPPRSKRLQKRSTKYLTYVVVWSCSAQCDERWT